MTMTFTINQDDWKKVLAEVVGTFFFFFLGISSALIWGDQLVNIALVHGLALAIAISALGHISGGHFNPAVTIGLLVARKISPLLAVFYIVAQIAGGVAACLAIIAYIPAQAWQAANLGTPAINTQIVNGYQATFLEAVLTFFLVLAVFGTAVDNRAAKIGGFGIGLTVFVDIMIGGPVTGGVMNPARALTPAIVSGHWTDDQFVYLAGPIIGAILAGLLYGYVFLPKDEDMIVEHDNYDDGETIDPPMSQPNLTKDVSSEIVS